MFVIRDENTKKYVYQLEGLWAFAADIGMAKRFATCNDAYAVKLEIEKTGEFFLAIEGAP
jgi:hypothetical protein